jgi:hypothetical protein
MSDVTEDGPADGEPGNPPGDRSAWLHLFAVVPPLVGLLALVLHCLTQPWPAALGALGTGIGVAVAAAAVGALLGFVFGIPRSLQRDPATGDADLAGDYRPNTNLEQISDWLTKILVGVGLVEVGNAAGPTRRLVGSVAAGLGGTASARVVAATAMTVFVIWGFLLAYVLVRTQVTLTFRQSDLTIVTRRAVKVVTGVVKRQIDEQNLADARALSLVDQVLSPSPEGPPVPQEDIDKAIRQASPSVRVQVFNRARQQRQQSWRNDKERMAFTIPVFRALVASDVDRRYHRNHGQLGYALKDQVPPDWTGAHAELNEAIELRGPTERRTFLLYEYNRAICRIHLAGGDPSVAPSRDMIIDDLQAASTSPLLRKALQREPDVVGWLETNHLTSHDLAR